MPADDEPSPTSENQDGGREEERRAPTIRESAQEYGRGIVGGLLFSLPLLFTRELWFTGFLASPLRLASAVVVTFGLLLAFNRVAGLREGASFSEVVVDSVEEYGLGLLIAAIVFWATGRLGEGVGLGEAIGLIVVGSLAASIGVSVGTAQLGDNPEREETSSTLWGQIIIALCGATIVAANVAPTAEVLTMALEATTGGLVLLLVATLALLAVATSFVELRGGQILTGPKAIPAAVFAPVAMYGIAMVAGIAFLAFFGRFDGNGFGTNLRQALVLSAPAAVGASVGRALILG